MATTRQISEIDKQKIIENWKTAGSHNYDYFQTAENQSDGFWVDGSHFRRFFDELNLESVLEIACGHGRHSARVIDKCRRLYLVDTSIDAIAHASERFAAYHHVSVHLSADGESLPFLPDQSITAVFSYDAMVHFELLTVAAYLGEIRRVLKPEGRALLHHSIYSGNPAGRFTDNPGWRNFMTPDIISHLASRAGLIIKDTSKMNWAAPESDQLTLFERA